MYNYNNYGSSQTTLGIPERWERVLAYSFGWISGIILLVVEQRNQTVRRHAMQSVVIFGVLSLIGLALFILSGIPLLGAIFGFLLGIEKGISFFLWIAFMVLAFFSAKTVITGPRYERFI